MMSNSSMPGMMMMMYFHLGIEDTILIKGWKAHNGGEFFGSFLFFFILAALYEGLKFYREVLHRYAMKKRKQIRDTDATDNEQLRESTNLLPKTRFMQRGNYKMSAVECALHMFQTFLHIVQVAVGYLLMLVVMTYNLWLFFAVVLGAGLGYLVFGWLRIVYALQGPGNEDHCN